MAQDHGLCKEKRSRKSQKPVHGPPLQARVAAANRTVCTTPDDDPGAHGNEQGAKQNERGKNVEEGSGHGMAKVAGKQSRQNRAAAGEHSRRTIRPAQALKQQLLQTIRPVQASQQNNSRR